MIFLLAEGNKDYADSLNRQPVLEVLKWAILRAQIEQRKAEKQKNDSDTGFENLYNNLPQR